MIDVLFWIFMGLFYGHMFFFTVIGFAEILYKKMDKGYWFSIYFGFLFPIAIFMYGVKELSKASKELSIEKAEIRKANELLLSKRV